VCPEKADEIALTTWKESGKWATCGGTAAKALVAVAH
jgi:hypothetical protein